MKSKERQSLLISMIPYNGYLMIKDLSVSLGVTEETVRRDLQDICAVNPSIKKIHGGVYRTTEEESAAPEGFRRLLLTNEKTLFSEYCVTLLKEGESIFLDSSTTSFFIAKAIKKNKLNLNLITNSLQTATLFTDDENTNVFLLGGKLRKRNCSLTGNETINEISLYCADFSFISPTSIDEKYGLCDNNSDEALVRKSMIEHSKKNILVSDHTKFGWTSVNLIAKLDTFDECVTDKQTPQKWIEILKQNNIKTTIC